VQQGLAANSTFVFEQGYRPGNYIAEVVQEGKQATVKLFKTGK
jgi:hypothetical protein